MPLYIQTPALFAPAPQEYKPDCLYLVCGEQGDYSGGDLMFVDEGAIERDDDGTIYGLSGRVYSEQQGYGNFGVMTHDVITNYTDYLRKRNAVTAIQRSWREAKRREGARVIQSAWRRWKVKRNELWNPHCFVGAVCLAMDFIRTTREQ